MYKTLDETREHVVTWSDAAGNRKTAVFLWSVELGWHWTEYRVPNGVFQRLLPRRDDQICYLELAAVVVAYSESGDQPWLLLVRHPPQE